MVPGLVFLAVLVVFAFIVVAKSVALIPQAEAAVIEGARVAGRPAAVRSVCSSDTAPASCTSGQGSPV